MSYAGLFEVLTGWTGSVAITVGATTITVEPERRESVASLFARIQMRALVELGLELVMSVVGERLSLAADAVFDMALSGNCEDRTKYQSGPYYGLSSGYVSDDPPDNMVVPASGMRLSDPTLSGRAGRAVADGSAAHSSLQAASLSLTMISTLQAVWAIEAAIAAWSSTQQTHDLWFDGRLLARLRFDGAPVRRPLTGTHGLTTSRVELVCPVTAVRE